MPTSGETRARLLTAAKARVAEQGYHGTSLAGVASDLGLTKQALLHHFGSKDALYCAVLDQFGRELLELLFFAMDAEDDAERQLISFVAAFSDRILDHPAEGALLMRAFLDGDLGVSSKAQSSQAQQMTGLQEFLEVLVGVFQATRAWQGKGFAEALLVATQVLGGLCLLPAALAQLSQVADPNSVAQAKRSVGKQAKDLIQARLALFPQ